MKVRRLALLGLVLGALAVGAAPAQAINDPKVPGEDCSPDFSAAVGDPLHPGNPGINFHTPDVSPPVSLNNPGNGTTGPGNGTGARGQDNSQAPGTCPNSL